MEPEKRKGRIKGFNFIVNLEPDLWERASVLCQVLGIKLAELGRRAIAAECKAVDQVPAVKKAVAAVTEAREAARVAELMAKRAIEQARAQLPTPK